MYSLVCTMCTGYTTCTLWFVLCVQAVLRVLSSLYYVCRLYNVYSLVSTMCTGCTMCTLWLVLCVQAVLRVLSS